METDWGTSLYAKSLSFRSGERLILDFSIFQSIAELHYQLTGLGVAGSPPEQSDTKIHLIILSLENFHP